MIVMAVDRVYAHLPNHDVPRGTVLAAGSLFELPSDNCGRSGDMGMRVGARYLVSAAFVSANGTALSNLIVWQIDGDTIEIPRGMYGLPIDAQELASAKTLPEALGLLGIQTPSPPTPTPTQPDPPSDGETPLPAGGFDTSAFGWEPIGASAAAVLAAVLLALYAARRRREL